MAMKGEHCVGLFEVGATVFQVNSAIFSSCCWFVIMGWFPPFGFKECGGKYTIDPTCQDDK